MADLEDELLQVAGRSAGRKGSQPSKGGKKRQTVASDSSGSDDDRYDRPPDEDESDEDSDRRPEKRTKVPLKKRRDRDEDEEESSSSESEDGRRGSGSDSELSFGEDLYKNKEDREKLRAMTELEREQILAERAERRDNWKLRRQVMSQRPQPDAAAAGGGGGGGGGGGRLAAPSPAAKAKSRTRDVDARKERALNDLRARRQRQQRDSERIRRGGEDSEDGEESDRPRRSEPRRRPREVRERSWSGDSDEEERDEDEEEDVGRGGGRRRGGVRSPSPRRGRPPPEPASSESRSEDEGSERDDEGSPRERTKEASIEDLRKLVIRRSTIARWFLEPFFEEVIVNCLVRLGIGMDRNNQPVYRVVEVVAVDSSDPSKSYRFESYTTPKYLELRWGKSTKHWQMQLISDRPPTDAEIDEWQRELRNCGMEPFSEDWVKEKLEATKNPLQRFQYTPAAVKAMLEEKRLASDRPRNAVMERERLRKAADLAALEEDAEKERKLREAVAELDDRLMRPHQPGQKTFSKRFHMIDINKRNREINYQTAGQGGDGADGKKGETAYDPFSRRWTRSQNYYRDAGAAQKEDGGEGPKSPDKGKVAVAEVVKAVPVDDRERLLAVHNFDIPLDLGRLQQFGDNYGDAYMVYKRMIETKCGVQAEVVTGPLRPNVLTMDDWNRRQELT